MTSLANNSTSVSKSKVIGRPKAKNKNVCMVKSKPKKLRKRFIIVGGKKLRISNLKENVPVPQKIRDHHLKPIPVKKAVEACLNDFQKKEKTVKLLGDPEPVFLQVAYIKKPNTPARAVRFDLPNTTHDDISEVCFIVNDGMEGKKRLDPEIQVQRIQDILRTKNVTSVKKIMTLEQLKTEYDQHELKRKLCHSFDFFLADNSLCNEVFPLCGKLFLKARKVPVLVHFNNGTGDLKERIQKALSKSAMKISSAQDSASCVIGNTSQPIDHLVENVVSVADQLDELFPGSFENVRSLTLKTLRSSTFPVYFSTKSPNEVRQPVTRPKRPKAFESVSGELSTIKKNVVLWPDGNIKIVRNLDNRSKLKKTQKRKITTDDIQTPEPKAPRKANKKNRRVAKTVEEDEASDTGEEDDGPMDGVEKAYLRSIRRDKKSKKTEQHSESKEEDQSAVDNKSKRRKLPNQKEAPSTNEKKSKQTPLPKQSDKNVVNGKSGAGKNKSTSSTPVSAAEDGIKKSAKGGTTAKYDTTLGETWSMNSKLPGTKGAYVTNKDPQQVKKERSKLKLRQKSKLNRSQKRAMHKLKKADKLEQRKRRR